MMKLKKIIALHREYKHGWLVVGQSEILIWYRDSKKPKSQHLSFSKSKILKQIDSNYFLRETVGKNHKKIAKQLPSSWSPLEDYLVSTKGQNGDVFLYRGNEDIIFGFDKHGNQNYEWNGINIGNGDPFYYFVFQPPNFLWLSFPTAQTVTQIAMPENKEIYTIGEYSFDEDHEFLSYPEDISIKGNSLYIPNMGNNKLFEVDLTTKEMSLLATFKESVWQYEKTEIGTFVVLDSGIYEIEEE